MGASRRDLQSIVAELRDAEIADPEGLAALASPSVRITAQQVAMAELKLGDSRFGGSPDVGPGFVWPTRANRPLTFLAQIDLSAAKAPGLPEQGWLLFFYEAIEQPWGFDPKDAGSAAVLFVDAPRDRLSRTEHPPVTSVAIRVPFEVCAVEFKPTQDLPDPWDELLPAHGLEIARKLTAGYATAAARVSGVAEKDQYHHLLGHPQLVQGDMREQCQLVTNGLTLGEGTDRDIPAIQELLKGAADRWRLLLQLDSAAGEEGPGWMWGDMGRIYFWIPGEDLATLNFGKAWLILQCG